MLKSIFLFIVIGLFCSLISGCEVSKTLPERGRTNITRYGSLIKVKKEFEERYIILHRNTFPGVLDRIRKSNIRNYSIFINEGLLFSHFEYVGKNFDEDMAQMGDPITKDWWKLTDPMQEPLENRKEGEWWASINLLYQMDTSTVNYKNAQRIALVGDINEKHTDRLKSILKDLNKSMVESVLNYNFQNLTLYTHDDRIYLYIEYVGKDFDADMVQLLKIREVKNLYEDMIALMEPLSGEDQFWVEMEEIFHTD